MRFLLRRWILCDDSKALCPETNIGVVTGLSLHGNLMIFV